MALVEIMLKQKVEMVVMVEGQELVVLMEQVVVKEVEVVKVDLQEIQLYISNLFKSIPTSSNIFRLSITYNPTMRVCPICWPYD